LVKKRGQPGTLEDRQVSSNVQADDFEEAMETDDFSLLLEEQTKRDGTGETQRMMSWIWLTGNASDHADQDEILQIEWAKSRARAARTAEEVLLLREEMCRVIEFLRWKAEWWLSRANHKSADKGMAEGLHAYAQKQALIQKNLSHRFQSIWKAPLDAVDIGGDKETEEDTDDKDAGAEQYVFIDYEDDETNP
jgi:hypothetical protein